ncbi:MAG: glycosyltransferase family 4 protein [bacterium]
MHILHANTFDIEGGAARAAWRLHKGLQALGTQSRMLVQTKTSGDSSVVERNSGLARQLGKFRPCAEILPLLPYSGRPPTHWATEWFPTRINRQIDTLNPDLIHLHWICRGFMTIADVGRLSKPVVWTLHDSWPFTGGCHVPGSCPLYRKTCGKCPQLSSTEEDDLSRWIWERKQKDWSRTPITVVTPSRWLADCARSSTLFGNRRIEVIPNGIDSGTYRPIPRQEARRVLALPLDRKLILMSAMNATLDLNKGFRFLEAALQQLAAAGWKDKVELLVVGQTAPSTPVNTGIPTRFLGVLKDDESMQQVYSATDVTVLTSLQENLPNSIMESMACGTPVAAFGVGGIPDLVEHKATGWLTKPTDSADLAAGLSEILSNDALRLQLGQASRKKVELQFDTSVIVKQYHALYSELLAH